MAPWFDIIDAAMSEFERHSKATVTIRIHSEGGSVYEALAIVGRLRQSKCHVVTEGYGSIMSAATLILACGDKRRISEFAFFMHHESYYGVEGRHQSNMATVKHYEREERMWCKWMEDFTEKDREFWYQTGQHVDEYFDAEQCVEIGIADEII